MILLELDCDFNNISVRSFILTGAPFANRYANHNTGFKLSNGAISRVFKVPTHSERHEKFSSNHCRSAGSAPPDSNSLPASLRK